MTDVLDTLRQAMEAMQYALWQYEGNGTPQHNHWSERIRQALDTLPQTIAAVEKMMEQPPLYVHGTVTTTAGDMRDPSKWETTEHQPETTHE